MERLRQTHSKEIESKDDEVEEIRQSCSKKVKFIIQTCTHLCVFKFAIAFASHSATVIYYLGKVGHWSKVKTGHRDRNRESGRNIERTMKDKLFYLLPDF